MWPICRLMELLMPQMQFYGECTAGHLNGASVCIVLAGLESVLQKTQEIPIANTKQGLKKNESKLAGRLSGGWKINQAEVKTQPSRLMRVMEEKRKKRYK